MSFIDDSALTIDSAEKKIKVAVIDSGFCDSFLPLFDSDIVLKGYDFIDDDEDTSSTNHHGSLVASLISSSFYGVDSALEILPLRVIDDTGMAVVDNVIKALEFAKEQDCQVINMSFGSAVDNQLMQQEISSFGEETYLVASAGDEKKGFFLFPAQYSCVIAVKAVDKNNCLYELSNTSKSKNAIMAPGVDVVMANELGNEITKSGSSYSATIVTGIIASCLSRDSLDVSNLKNFDVYDEQGHLNCGKFLL